jgi:hypothetical protein
MGGKMIRAGILCALATCALAIPAPADEIRLKDGKKLYGVIVAYEDNMFKIKTDFGYVLVEKDKIASIVPSTPVATAPAKAEPKPATKKQAAQPAKAAPEPVTASIKEDIEPQAEPAVGSSKLAPVPQFNAEAGPSLPHAGATSKSRKTSAKAGASTPTKETVAENPPTFAPPTAIPPKPAPAAVPAPPKEPEVPAIREEIQGNYYTNYTHGFRMYKPPSWSLIEDARKALPNAIVAMGTSNESTLLVVGQEKTKEPLEAAAATVEKRLREVYDNYQKTSERKSSIGGMPAVEYHYRGTADDHAWSGTLVVVGRGADILTVLGMTYADTDLIQIQENVISRSIASLDFSAH